MPDPAHSISVLYEQATPRLRRTHVRLMALRIAELVAKGRGFACLVAGEETSRRLNRDFRGKDESTDVLSFPSGVAVGPLGDLAISIEHARAQSTERGHGVEQEIGVLMLHGVLHLMGMDHETDKGQMRRAEARWRRELGLPLSLTERVAGPVSRARPATEPLQRGSRAKAPGSQRASAMGGSKR